MSASLRLSSCRQQLFNRSVLLPRTRSLATEATPIPSASAQSAPTTPHAQGSKTKHHLQTSIVLNRSPIITRTPTRFERAYYAYQQRIQRALHNPFPYDFYFKQGSILEAKFNAEERRRERKAFGAPFGLPPESKDNNETQRMNESAAEELTKEDDEEPASRITQADLAKDVKSLDRKLQRNLYLLLLRKDGEREAWGFPQGSPQKGELLHEAAERTLAAECDVYMDSWIVSRNPIGHSKTPGAVPSLGPLTEEAHTFFYKAHILAGQVRPVGQNVIDFAWLTKQEIQPHVGEHYWTNVKDLLADF
ncbi:hypothetical protein JAAARDRAFT_151102 [Jaapia argillacea MUCL 33604]|uniref:Large ribosomal subunit protein mL46 n=1 Tax=Jaapia argillacea MUCL 33604 TaxID=933084 RepID=A0A067Q0V6_9AGAM|nr:hypothetical protein JAAARDRAFT_151102 [Jaapia argillacea MUCL 33604]